MSIDPKQEARRIIKDYKDMLKLREGVQVSTRPLSIENHNRNEKLSPSARLEQVEEFRKMKQRQAQPQSKEPKKPRPNVPIPSSRKQQLEQLRQRKKKMQAEVRQKEYQLQKISQSRKSRASSSTRPNYTHTHQNQFKQFRVERLIKALTRLQTAFSKLHLRSFEKAMFRVKVEEEEKVRKGLARVNRRLMERCFGGFEILLEEGRARKEEERVREEMMRMDEKWTTAVDFYEFCLLKRHLQAMLQYKEKRKAKKKTLFEEQSQPQGKVRRFVEELKMINKQEEQVALPIISEEDLQQKFSEVQSVSNELSEDLCPIEQKQEDNPLLSPKRKGPISHNQLMKRKQELDQKNRKRKEKIEEKKKAREEQRLQQLRQREEEEREKKQQQKHRKIEELRKFQAKRKLQEQRKRRREQEQRMLEQKMIYAAAYHQRNIVKYSGFLLLKKAISILQKDRESRLQIFNSYLTKRYFVYFQDGVEDMRRDNMEVQAKLMVHADAFRNRWRMKRVVVMLKEYKEIVRLEGTRIDAFKEVKLISRSFRAWKRVHPEIAHENLCFEMHALQTIRHWQLLNLGKKVIRGLQINLQECKLQKYKEKYEKEYKEKVSEWLKQLPAPNLEQFL